MGHAPLSRGMAHSLSVWLKLESLDALCLVLGVVLVLDGEIGIAYDGYDNDGDTYCYCCHDDVCDFNFP